MIEVSVLEALENISFGRNATFKKGERYFARLSRNEDFYVMRSEEGYWIPISSFKENGYCIWNFIPKGFERKSIIYMRNRKRLNEFHSVELYFLGDNCEKWWYDRTRYEDVKLYE